MKIESLHSDARLTITSDANEEVIFAQDLIGAIVASLGPEESMLFLSQGLSKLAQSLYEQNYGDVGTEAYDVDDPKRGELLERLAGQASVALFEIHTAMEEAKAAESTF